MDEDLDSGAAEPLASSRVSISTMPLPPRRQRSGSAGDFPPPPMMARSSTDASGAPRPVPLAAKFQRLHPGTTGVTVLEHLERLDAVEASLQRLTVDGAAAQEEEDVADSVVKPKTALKVKTEDASPRQPSSSTSPLLSPPASPPQVLSTLHEARETPSTRSSLSTEEEDLVALSKSTSHAMSGPLSAGLGSVWENEQRGMDWLQQHDPSDSKRTVIVEVSANLCSSLLDSYEVYYSAWRQSTRNHCAPAGRQSGNIGKDFYTRIFIIVHRKTSWTLIDTNTISRTHSIAFRQ